MSEGYTRAQPGLYCSDAWHPIESFTPIKQRAYKIMEERGEIQIIKVTGSRSKDRIVIEYYSTIPKDWIHSALKKIVEDMSSQTTIQGA